MTIGGGLLFTSLAAAAAFVGVVIAVFAVVVAVVVVSVMSSIVIVGSGDDGDGDCAGDGDGDRTIGVGPPDEGASVLSRETSRAKGRRMFVMSSAVHEPLTSGAYSMPIMRFT